MEISIATSRLAHDKGYPLIDSKFSPTYNYSQENDYKLGFNVMTSQDLIDFKIYPAPTQSLLQKWLREIHNIDIIISSNLIGYGYVLYQRSLIKNITSKDVYQTYEEALEKGLQEALKLIKE